eukprot:TRINITY_DN5018_c0_g1_i4.p1 TRINITY_DN5018_c0_g1~~TRINITY_DN5018_c0_g1_i4.p1  ORF type:complete len:110 (-),score=35.79 TRINITY_DN5018_c0_g1_i4:50-379(-)
MWIDPLTVDHVRVTRGKAAMAFLTYICSYIAWSHYQKEFFGKFPYPVQEELGKNGLIIFYVSVIVISLLIQQIGLKSMKEGSETTQPKKENKKTKKGKTTLKKKPTKVE